MIWIYLLVKPVPKAGVEPARPLGHCPLKTACLPIPPLRQIIHFHLKAPEMQGETNQRRG